VVIPAVEAGLQRGTLVMQPADNQFTRPGRRGDRAGLQSKEVPLATMQRHVGSAFSASSAVKRHKSEI
jgi:hypothetical protein